jgi:hypothetical protein
MTSIVELAQNQTTLVSVTRLRLRSIRYLPAFLWMSVLSSLQAKRSPGNLKVKLAKDANLTFWTLTAWENETMMRSYIKAGSHRQAMSKLVEWCDEASLVHWYQETSKLPTLKEAHRRMEIEGKIAKVNYPSSAQMLNQIPAPKI